ncbi:MGMT family protein [Lactococcus termiticola]|uniref:Methylated-DNA-[protein]-cysteine S-methyltransferase DNA binding domain-containing protein n=1 Tax=Lactococcus termiticola TaxID=2169526 RepID=A0A2R5HH19_9LACT|nr:MGMT family protein [Lactococcus termiticola]GBG97304.1 hypothetical protein NtB2_01443 [Lactococcus termiticola]
MVENDFDDFVLVATDLSYEDFRAGLSPELKAEFDGLKPVTKQILAVIADVPYGTATSYKDVGSKAGLVNGARQVARVLHGLSEKYELPWWRIVKADRRIALTGAAGAEQARLLRLEGIEVTESGRLL